MFVTLALLALAADPTPDELARDLGSPVFAVREKASKELWKRGASARAALEAAAKGGDPEVTARAAAILEKFDWGVFPDTPANVLALIREFRTGDADKQLRAIDGLLDAGDRGLDTLALILTRDFPADQRERLFDHYTRRARRRAAVALFENDATRAERLLEPAALALSEPGWADYALFMHQQGKLPAAVDRLGPLRKLSGDRGRAAGLAFAFTLHVAGRSADALKVADERKDDEPFAALAVSIREDSGRWAELAAVERPVEHHTLARQWMWHKLAGQREASNRVAKALTDRAVAEDMPEYAATTLLLGGRHRDGLPLLRSGGRLPDRLADVLAARLDLPGVLDIKVEPDSPAVLPYQFRRGRALAQLGRRDESTTAFRHAADELRSRDQRQVVDLLRCELRAGRPDLAADHAAKFLDLFDKTGEGFHAAPTPFELLFADDAEPARGCWTALRKHGTKSTPAETMARVRELLSGKASADTRADAVSAIGLWEDQVKRSDYPNPADLCVIAQARAAAFRAAGQLADAEKQFALAAGFAEPTDDTDEDRRSTGPRAWLLGTDEGFRPWQEYGDFLADRGRNLDAATAYLDGWKRFPDCPILMYLSGRALLLAGDAAEGNRRIDLSHRVSFGSTKWRGRFLDELCTRGRAADLRRERELLAKVVWFYEPTRGNAWNQAARAATLAGDHEAAAAATERLLNYILRSDGVSFADGAAYLTVPASVPASRARAKLAAGDVSAALALAAEHHDALPGAIELAVALVPELDRLGKRADADALFAGRWAVYRKLAADHPASGWAHATAATLAAGCRRELDAGLKHALKAVESDGESKPYREALAEVRFRRGERDAAVTLMEALLTDDPRNRVYRRQLVRYREGDTGSPVPIGPDG